MPMTEPLRPRYIYVNPTTNIVHLLVPIVCGQEISTDNTCKVKETLTVFFDGGALHELNAYKDALLKDIQLLGDGEPLRVAKESRLEQIKIYIAAMEAMRHDYSDAITRVLQKDSNLYGIQLRPFEKDPRSEVINPVFSVNRHDDASGTSLSELFNAMQIVFSNQVIKTDNPCLRLKKAVLEALPSPWAFEDIQRLLHSTFLTLFGGDWDIDFTHQMRKSAPADKRAIDELMRFDAHTTPEHYIDALLGVCAPYVWNTMAIPPFYRIPGAESDLERRERLSLLTQFFLAIVNIYCKAQGISSKNFGHILDGNPELCFELVGLVSKGLALGVNMEEEICIFMNLNKRSFGLCRSLNIEDFPMIRQLFERTYSAISPSGQHYPMDDFIILDKMDRSKKAIFVTHQGSLCINFAEIVKAAVAAPKRDYFERVRADFSGHAAEIPPQNECVVATIESSADTLSSAFSGFRI